MNTQLSSVIDTHENAPNIMMHLKNDTAAAHKNLEKSACFKRLFADDYTLSEYAQLLGFFYGYFSAIEPVLFADLPQQYHSDLQYRAKIQLLRQDLTFLDTNADELPLCETLPELTSSAQKMGALYVLEGSLLGGRVISRHLISHFGADIVSALNFYHCYGDNLDKQWRGFSAFMMHCFDKQNDKVINEVIDAANATFTTLQQWVELCSGDSLHQCNSGKLSSVIE